MKYIKLVIAISDEYQESLIAELSDRDFDAFEQQDGQLITYVEKERFSVGDREYLEELLAGYPGNSYIESEELVADQNWNEQWEQTIRAQQIGRFFVRPTWSRVSAPAGSILLEIDPKMAFGTGYHETTRLMLQLLPEAIYPGGTVLDAGTGTGILAIASIKLGARQAFAFDIDEWSSTNARENILLNGVADNITVKKGSAEVIPKDASFDVVLANIERNPILEMLPVLAKALKPGGNLLLSGLLETDRERMLAETESHSLRLENVRQENEWIALRLVNVKC